MQIRKREDWRRDLLTHSHTVYQLSQMFPLPRHCAQNAPTNQKSRETWEYDNINMESMW